MYGTCQTSITDERRLTTGRMSVCRSSMFLDFTAVTKDMSFWKGGWQYTPTAAARAFTNRDNAKYTLWQPRLESLELCCCAPQRLARQTLPGFQEGRARDPYLIGGHESHTWPADFLGLCWVPGFQPGGLRHQEEVQLAVLLAEQPLALAQLLRQRLVLDVVQHELRVGHQRIPVGLEDATKQTLEGCLFASSRAKEALSEMAAAQVQ